VVLVPFADFLNHDPGCEAYLQWEEQQQAVVLRPDRDYSPGQQVGRQQAAGTAVGHKLCVSCPQLAAGVAEGLCLACL
jgi:hypothetical protein